MCPEDNNYQNEDTVEEKPESINVFGGSVGNSGNNPPPPFEDNRPEAIAQKELNQSLQKKPNKERTQEGNGLPLNIQLGLESLSGMDLSDVVVHYNSSLPNQYNAEAFASGNEIFLAPGQEDALPEEAAHIVQQKQGNVQPLRQYEQFQLNDDPELEEEAVEMGNQALREYDQFAINEKKDESSTSLKKVKTRGNSLLQRRKKKIIAEDKKETLMGQWVEIRAYGGDNNIYEDVSPVQSEVPMTTVPPGERIMEKKGEVQFPKGKRKEVKIKAQIIDVYDKYVQVDLGKNGVIWMVWYPSKFQPYTKVLSARDLAENSRERKYDVLYKGEMIKVVSEPEAHPQLLDKVLKVESDDLENDTVKVFYEGDSFFIEKDCIMLYKAEYDTAMQPETEDEAWFNFASILHIEFADILHIFQDQTPKDGEEFNISPEYLQGVFTVGQRDKLMNFFQTGVIPDRLFTDDSGAGNLSAQQRILISAHIMARGKYQSKDTNGDLNDPRKTSSENCGEWVRDVFKYAGVNENNPKSRRYLFDHAGNIVLGETSAKENVEYPFYGTDITYNELDPTQEGKRIDGEVQPGEGSDRHREAWENAPEDKKHRYKQMTSLPFEDLDKLEPGDWLWYYSGNTSGRGAHSVVFAGWVDNDINEEKRPGHDPVKYRTAYVYSRLNSKSGGISHKVRLGEIFFRYGKWFEVICPVTMIRRAKDVAGGSVDEESNPEVILDDFNNKTERENEKFMLENEFDDVSVRNWLYEQNYLLLEDLVGYDVITDSQFKLLAGANEVATITELVGLNQKLSAYVVNVEVEKGINKMKKGRTDGARVKTDGKLKNMKGLIPEMMGYNEPEIQEAFPFLFESAFVSNQRQIYHFKLDDKKVYSYLQKSNEEYINKLSSDWVTDAEKDQLRKLNSNKLLEVLAALNRKVYEMSKAKDEKHIKALSEQAYLQKKYNGLIKYVPIKAKMYKECSKKKK